MAKSCATWIPNQFFLNGAVGVLASQGRSHEPLTQSPVSQSLLVSQLGAVWHVASHRRPDLHSVELLHSSPQSLLPRAHSSGFFSPQPGKSGGQSPVASQRAGGSPSEKDGGSAAV